MESVSARARVRHEPALDGLRGAAVAAVLFFHGGHLAGGYLGVDAFFVLSGFLITSLLLAEVRQDGSVSLHDFWARRARRLLPALVCVVLAVALYAAWVAKLDELATIRGDAIATLLYVANWRAILAQHDYWALFRSPSPLQHTWSLSIEEQFYVLWPVVFVLVARARRGADIATRVLWTALVAAGVSFVFTQLMYNQTNPSNAYYSTVTRMGSILLGAALAALLSRAGSVRGHRGRRALEVGALACVLGLALAWTRLSGSSPFLFRGGFLLCALATCVVIAAAVHPEHGLVSRGLSLRPLCALGLVSYGVYLWHWPIYVVLDSKRAHVSGWLLLAIRVAVTLAIAIVSYHFVEQPIRNGTVDGARLRRVVPAVAITLAVAVFVSTTGAVPPVPTAVTAPVKSGILVVGDSVAASLGPGIADLGQPVSVDYTPGCRLIAGKLAFDSLYGSDCPWQRHWAARVAYQHPVTAVLMPGVWDLFDVQPHGASSYVGPGSDAWTNAYRSSLDDAIATLSSTGAHVVLTTALCVRAIPGATGGKHSALDVDRVRAANTVVTAVANAHPRTVTLMDLFGFVCPNGHYQDELGSLKHARPDGEHFSAKAAAVIARWMRPYLLPPPPHSPSN